MNDRDRPTAAAPTVACALIGPALAERKAAIARDLFAHAEAVEELADGFAYRFPSGEPWPTRALAFITAERQCCPFFAFELIFSPHHGPLWLRVRGSVETKAFWLAEIEPTLQAP